PRVGPPGRVLEPARPGRVPGVPEPAPPGQAPEPRAREPQAPEPRALAPTRQPVAAEKTAGAAPKAAPVFLRHPTPFLLTRPSSLHPAAVSTALNTGNNRAIKITVRKSVERPDRSSYLDTTPRRPCRGRDPEAVQNDQTR